MVGQGDLVESFNYRENKHFMEPILSATTTGFIVTVEGVSYLMQWFDSMLKVTGPDVCYYILETARGIERADCTLNVFTLLVAN
jgi:hypothetical protein